VCRLFETTSARQPGLHSCRAPIALGHDSIQTLGGQLAGGATKGAECRLPWHSPAHSPAANGPFDFALHLRWVACRWRIHGIAGCGLRGIVHWARLLGVVHWCRGKLLRRVLSARWGCHGWATSCRGVGGVGGGLIVLCLWCCANCWCCCCVVMVDVLLCGLVFCHTNNDQGLQQGDTRQVNIH
jgi:hypothetical protein